jgi:hypothetical protein
MGQKAVKTSGKILLSLFTAVIVKNILMLRR